MIENGTVEPKKTKKATVQEATMSFEDMAIYEAADKIKMLDLNTITPIEAMNFIFDANDNSWSMEYNNQVNKLISIDGNKAVLYTVNGETMNVTLDAVGVNAARQMFMGSYAMN
jgi:hypothetical protein